MVAISDVESGLIKRCLQGESEAWNALFDQYYAATGRFVFQLGYAFSREDVDEICQEVFLSVVKNLHTFQGQSRFQTWLFCIASNRARDFRQRQQATKRGGHAVTLSIDREDPVTGLKLDPPGHEPSADRVLLREEQIVLVGEALEHLGGPCQEIIEYRYFGDLSYDEISKALRLNPKTVSSRLSKCLDKLEVVLRKLMARETHASTSIP